MFSPSSLSYCKNCYKIQQTLSLNKIWRQRNIIYPSIYLFNCTSTTGRGIFTKTPSINDEDSFFEKMKTKFRMMYHKNRLIAKGYYLYESIADNVDYIKVMKELKLPDTFYSWFVITELHVWMLMARLMAEGEEGRFLRNRIVSSFWEDLGQRSKKLGAANPSGVREQAKELAEQFQAAVLSYDEGIASDDTVLAAAVWRRIYQYQITDPENIEYFVKYIRRQMKLLDMKSGRDLIEKQEIIWGMAAKSRSIN